MTKSESNYGKVMDTMMSKIINESEIAFFLTNQSIEWSAGEKQVFGVVRENNKWYSVKYKINSSYKKIPETLPLIEKNELNHSKGDSILNVFNTYLFSNIKEKNERGEANTSGRRVAVYHQIISATKSQCVLKEYFDPEYSNEMYPGNKDREIFLTCKKAILSVQ